jgi:O-antigen ligase
VPLLAALVAAPVLVAVSAVVSPRSFGHLVLLFGRQMRHFGQSSYGLIYTRAASIGLANPLTGLGFDGFRHGCPQPIYFRDWPPWGPYPGDGGGAAICVQHAHNHYLQALTDSGVPGLLLFCATVLAWLAGLARGLSGHRGRHDPILQAWRVGLFAAVLVHEWPIASASAFTNMPLGGWFFLLLGIGLAEAAASGPLLSRPLAAGHRPPISSANL